MGFGLTLNAFVRCLINICILSLVKKVVFDWGPFLLARLFLQAKLFVQATLFLQTKLLAYDKNLYWHMPIMSVI